MRRAPQILIALLLLLPLASWLTTTGGLPACCSGRSCAMGAQCPMAAGGMTMGKARCSMSAAPQLSLPAAFFPVMPLPRRVHGVPTALLVPSTPAADVGAILSGFPSLLFHPPSA